jgi:hypothetical protein
MKRLIFAGMAAGLMIATMLFGFAGNVPAAHLGNNRAELTGTGDPDATGLSLVNFRKGTENFNASASATNLDPEEDYTFLVRNAAGVEREICSAETSSKGTFMCGEQGVLPDLFGLSRAVIRDSTGVEVLVGVYELRGNCRAPDLAGSQCQAPGHQD